MINIPVSTCSKRAFEGLLQLLTLNLSSNGIQQLQNDIFIGLPSLRNLDLSFNSLTKLDNKTNGVLDDLLSLETLDLSHNRISFVTKKTFPSHQYIPYNLRNLNLSYLNNNQLDKLFQLPISLNELHFSHNQLTEIPAGTWPVMNSLIYLDLSHNQLGDSLNGLSFTGLLVVQRLKLQNNGISQPPREAVAVMSTLQYLYLEVGKYNEIEKF